MFKSLLKEKQGVCKLLGIALGPHISVTGFRGVSCKPRERSGHSCPGCMGGDDVSLSVPAVAAEL